jgi:hypothetical protein
MIRDEKLERTIERAIQSAFVDFPDAGNGTVWPKTYKEPNECKTIATAVLSALENAGYKISLDSNRASREAGMRDLREGLRSAAFPAAHRSGIQVCAALPGGSVYRPSPV